VRTIRRRSTTTIAAVGLVATLLPASLAAGATTLTAPAGPLVSATSSRVTLLGRWGRDQGVATTVNSGSRALLRFTGRRVTAVFAQQGISFPPQVYAWVDGKRHLYTVSHDRINLTPRALSPGRHRLQLAVKDVDERGERWTPPFASALRLVGFRLSRSGHALRPPHPSGPRIEFLGDSITQGVRAVGPNIGILGSDATKDHAWLVGQAFGGNFRQTGFGAQGITVPGGGGVPVASESLGLNFAGSPVTRAWAPQAVVVNQGTNDALGGKLAGFEPAYRQFLQNIHQRWPRAWIFALRPFGGYADSQIRSAVQQVHRPKTVYVDTTGWVPHLRLTDGLHPTVTGHIAAARHLEAVIQRQTGWHPGHITGAQASLLPAGAAKSFEGSGSQWKPGSNVDSVAPAPATTPEAYQGQNTLQVKSATAPQNEWRSIVLDRPVRLTPRARSLFAYVTVPNVAVPNFDARISVVVNGRTHTQAFRDVPNLAGFLPWNRIHVGLPGGGHATRTTISVRASSGETSGAVDFQVDAVGWASRPAS
jgi:lysophospholipase L1-like esterase